MFAQRERPASPAVWFGVVCLYLVATRWPLAPRHLYYFDSANFALALEHFDPALHQPQPPGYPLFVGLTRLIHYFVFRAEHVFLIAGLLAAIGSVVAIWKLGREIFGYPAGMLGAALLASNPVFWFGGITNQIRVFLAFIALTVALLAWRAIQRPDEPRWFYGMFAALAIGGGFRPALPINLLPLALWVWWRCGRRPRHLALGAATLAAASLPWIAAAAWAVGGPERYIQVLMQYANEQFEGSSALFGAPAASAMQMVRMALVWNLLGVVAWVWAAPFVWRGIRANAQWRERATFLLVATAPAVLFSAFVHIGDPDQALASVSMLCLAGGGVLAAFCRAHGRRALATVGGAVVVAQTALFFFPPTKLAKAASYRHVAAVDRMVTAAVTSIEALRRDGPLTIVHYGSSVASRQLAYYFPDDYVVVLPASAAERPQIWRRHQAIDAPAPGAGYLRPGSTRVVCLLPWNSHGGELPGWEKRGSVYWHDSARERTVKVGAFRLIRGDPSDIVAGIR